MRVAHRATKYTHYKNECLRRLSNMTKSLPPELSVHHGVVISPLSYQYTLPILAVITVVHACADFTAKLSFRFFNPCALSRQ